LSLVINHRVSLRGMLLRRRCKSLFVGTTQSWGWTWDCHVEFTPSTLLITGLNEIWFFATLRMTKRA